jgi:hypothetical protein
MRFGPNLAGFAKNPVQADVPVKSWLSHYAIA